MGINWVTFFAQIVNLFVLIWLLKRFLYRPILQAVEKRQAEIMNKVNRAKEEYDLAEAEHKKLLKKQADFDAQKQQKFDEVLQETENLKNKWLSEIQNEAQKMRQKMQDDLNRQAINLHTQIRDMMADNFVTISKKIASQIAGMDCIEHSIDLFQKKVSGISKTDAKKIKSAYQKIGIISISSSETLTETTQKKLAQFLSETFDWELPLKMKFETDTDLILGLEMTVGDICIQWHLKEYLDEYQTNLNTALAGLIVKE